MEPCIAAVTLRSALVRISCIICCVVIFPRLLTAQPDYLHFNHLTTADGLSNNNVRSACQDQEGFLWFTTQGGLNRYDGKHFVVYRHSFYDSASISSNAVFNVAADHRDNIWVTTSNSISCLDRQTGRFINYYCRDARGNIITNTNLFESLAIISPGEPLAYSRSLGLLRVDRLHHQLVPAHFSFIPLNTDPRRLSLTSGGWIGYRNETSFFVSNDGGKHFWKALEKRSVFPDTAFSSLKLIAADSLNCWLAITSIPFHSLTSCFKVTVATKHIQRFHVRPANLTAITPYPGRIYWMGFWGDGIAAYNDATGKMMHWYTHHDKDPNTLSNEEVQGIYRDKDNTLWIATDEGIDYCNPVKDNMHLLNNNIEGFNGMDITNISCLAEDEQHRIWAGMENYGGQMKNGLLCLDPKTFKYTRFLDKEIHEDANMIWEILPEDARHLLLSTQKGLYQFDMTSGSLNRSFLYPFPSLVLDNKSGLPVLEKDKKGNYWFGLWMEGLIKFSASTRQQVHFSSAATDPRLRLSNDFVTALAEDEQQRMWVINARNNIIDCIDTGNTVHHFPLIINGQAFSSELKAILADHDGTLWIGTKEGGLLRFDPSGGRIRLFTVSDGLLSETINSLCLDDRNRLWVYTAAGLVWIDSSRETVHQLDNDILRFRNSADDEPILFSRNRNIYIGDRQTIVFFDPDKILSLQQVRPPFLIAVHKMDKVTQATPAVKEVSIFPGEDFLSFDFVSPDMMHSRQISYAYRLTGYNGHWLEMGNEGTARFTRLPPGRYELQMRATLPGVRWDGRYTAVALNVIPHFYQTWWCRALLLLTAGCALGYLIYYLSTNRLRQRLALMESQQQITGIRNRIAQDIHDEIGSGLTKISIQSELAKHQEGAIPPEYLKIMEHINLQSHELVNNLGEIVWTINPQYDKLDSVLAYFRHYIHRFFVGLPLQYHIDFSDPAHNPVIHPDIKRNLFLVLKESLHNVIKHARATGVTVSLEIHSLHYKMSIADNGRGFPEKPDNEFGNGLGGMRKRAQQIHASLEIDSRPDTGTTIRIAGEFYGPA